jgi:hypothetical protein
MLALGVITLLLPSRPGSADEVGPADEPAPGTTAASVITGITCRSPAQISFFPTEPQAERVVRIDVLAPAHSTEVTLLSSLRLYYESEAQEPLGYRWSWFTWSEFPGDYEITFLDSMRSECATARLVIGDAGMVTHPAGPAVVPIGPPFDSSALAPGATPTRTPRVVSLSRSSSSNDNDDNDDDSSSSRKPTATRTRAPTKTPVPTRTPQPEEPPRPTRTPVPTATEVPHPEVASTSPSSAICGNTLTIKGRGFGSKRDPVDGRVKIAEREVSGYEDWGESEIRVVVHSNTPTGPAERLIVETRGGADSLEIKVSC